MARLEFKITRGKQTKTILVDKTQAGMCGCLASMLNFTAKKYKDLEENAIPESEDELLKAERAARKFIEEMQDVLHEIYNVPRETK